MQYDRELIYDLNLQAFYTNTFTEITPVAGKSPYVVGYLDVSNSVFTNQVEQVVAGAGGDVQVNGEDVEVTLRVSDQVTQGSTKYWTITGGSGTTGGLNVAGFFDLDFVDWSDTAVSGGFGGDAEAILLTGYTLDGDFQSEKKLPYITVYMKRTEDGFTADINGDLVPIDPSSCLFQTQWEWTDDTVAGRWTTERDIYRLPRNFVPTGIGTFDYGFTVVKTKNRVRGKGSALSMQFKSSPGKNLILYGWSREITIPQ